MIAMILLFVAVGLVVILTTATRNQQPVGASARPSPHTAAGVSSPNRTTPTTANDTRSPSPSGSTPSSQYDLASCIVTLNTGSELVHASVALARSWQTYLATESDQQASLQALTSLRQAAEGPLATYTDLHAHSLDPDQVCTPAHQISPPPLVCLQRSTVISTHLATAQAIADDVHHVLGQAEQLSRQQISPEQFAQSRRSLLSSQRSRVASFLGGQNSTSAAEQAIDDSPQCISSAVAIISGSATGTMR